MTSRVLNKVALVITDLLESAKLVVLLTVRSDLAIQLFKQFLACRELLSPLKFLVADIGGARIEKLTHSGVAATSSTKMFHKSNSELKPTCKTLCIVCSRVRAELHRAVPR